MLSVTPAPWQKSGDTLADECTKGENINNVPETDTFFMKTAACDTLR